MLTKVITFSCFLAVSLAAPTADADPQLLLAGLGAPAIAPLAGANLVGAAVGPALLGPAVVAPAVLAPAPVVLPPNCVIEHEVIETQVCTPRAETVCETKEVIAQAVTYEKLCKEVTSRHCAGLAAPVAPFLGALAGHVVAKREAEPYYGLGGFGGFGGYGHHLAAPVAYAAHEETITSPCHEVVSEHCLNSPVVEETAVPIEQCHVVNKVDCVPEVQKIAKTVCTPVESKVVRHLAAHPFAYQYGK
jgi:hypothetical protein